MQKNLVIVESPAKAKTIEKFLGKDYKVMSSYGHIRDLKEKEFSIDIEHNYAPKYVIPADKKKLWTYSLKTLSVLCSMKLPKQPFYMLLKHHAPSTWI